MCFLNVYVIENYALLVIQNSNKGNLQFFTFDTLPKDHRNIAYMLPKVNRYITQKVLLQSV